MENKSTHKTLKRGKSLLGGSKRQVHALAGIQFELNYGGMVTFSMFTHFPPSFSPKMTSNELATKVGFQGQKGAYSEAAVQDLFDTQEAWRGKNVEPVGFHSFQEVRRRGTSHN